jgi:lipid II:glycine glycyltransferase (peptidoglycan interpeptide bridge formation enzyme)
MNDLVFRELGLNEPFDLLALYPDSPFTQAQFYGQWQVNLGREVKRFVISCDEKVVAYFQLIKYPLWRNKNYFYVPYGPITEVFSEVFFTTLQQKLKSLAQTENAVFIRLDFTPPVSNTTLSKFFTKAPLYTYHSAHFQPRREWSLSLDKTEEDLLKDMHEKTRYSIRLAERKGIMVEIITEDFEKYFENFYELMLGTAKRNGFNLHSKNYYQNIFQNLQSDNAYLVIAKYGAKILVSKLIIRYGQTAYSVFSGSSNDYRDLRPTYLVQWVAICQAKKLGHRFYNFGGISAGKIYKGWSGLTVFKKNFGGAEIIHSDFFDIITQPFWYHLYNFRKFIKNWVKV